MCFFRFEIGGVVVEDSRWGCLFYFLFIFFFFFKPPQFVLRTNWGGGMVKEFDCHVHLCGSNPS